MRLKHKSPSRHRADVATRTYGWATFMGWFQAEQDAPTYEPPAQTPTPTTSATLPSLPPGSMAQRPQRPILPLTTHTYRGGLYASADLTGVAGRVTAGLRPAFRLDIDTPMFRGEDTTWEQFEDSRLERLRRIQSITDGWPDEHGVNLGHGQSPKTLVFSTALYDRFSDGTGVIPAVTR